MAKIKVIDQTGKAAGNITLDDVVFGAQVKIPLIHQVAMAQLANKRQGTKSALTRSEVAGGGRKPWRQKGTGNARQGSIRSPQWRHGGVVFAPKPRDFSQKINKIMKKQAFKSAISGKLADGELMVVDTFNVTGKTKEMVKIAADLNFGKNILLVLGSESDMVVRSAGNISSISTIDARELSVLDIVNHTQLIATTEAIKFIEEAYKA